MGSAKDRAAGIDGAAGAERGPVAGSIFASGLERVIGFLDTDADIPPRTQHVMSFKHVHYTQGQVLGVDDFQAEQNYCLDKHRRHNRYLHGWGVVWGLTVSMAKHVVTVEPGFALDCVGNELELESPTTLPVPRSDEGSLVLVIQYKECPTDPTPIPGEPRRTEKDSMAPSRILETVELLFRDKDFLTGHHCPPGQKTCGKPHPVPIALINERVGGWVLDRRFLVPRCKDC